MKILVTGAGGQLGRELVAFLERERLDVTGCTRDGLDIRDKEAVTARVEQIRPHWVINCGAYTRVDRAEEEIAEAFAVNSDGAAHVARAAAQAGARLVHISTDFVFDGKQSTPYDEQAACHPQNAYGMSKREGEQRVLENFPDALILRTAWIYGQHGANFVKTILRLARQQDRLRVVADQVGTPTWARDIARVIHALLSTNARGIFHFTDDGTASWYDFACAILEEARTLEFETRAREVVPIGTEDFPTAARRPAYSVLDKSKILNLLKQPVPHWRMSLRAFLQEFSACPDYW